MEDPSYWGEAERIISIAMDEHQEATNSGVYGASLPMAIATKLRDAGLLAPRPSFRHNHFTRSFEPKTCDVCADTVTGKRMLGLEGS